MARVPRHCIFNLPTTVMIPAPLIARSRPTLTVTDTNKIPACVRTIGRHACHRVPGQYPAISTRPCCYDVLICMAILPTRATLLSTRIGELRDWSLIAWCPCRSFPRHLPVDRFAQEFGTRPTLERILGRLRCEKCRRAPGRVEAKRGDPFASRAAPIVLLESRRAVDRNRG